MPKKKVLCWSDASTAGTGFGIVSKHVIGALYATEKYDIHHLAINFHGDFVDKNVVPWQVQPARLLDPQDPHGMKMFFRTMMKIDYDIVWILNDLYVTHEVAASIAKVRNHARSKGKKPPVFIYYYPVDCHVNADSVGMLEAADICVCYTQHGRDETMKTIPGVKAKLREIPHGVDTNSFYPLPQKTINSFKKSFLNIEEDVKVIVSVNRNSTRKQIPYSMMAFKEFRKREPNSIMYIHSMVRDQGGDLSKVMNDLNLSVRSDIVFPAKFSPAEPAPVDILNKIYNMGDAFLTTHLGEGWGLTVTEAMAAGTPVISPNNTAMPQQLGNNSERGYMYPCTDWTWIDLSGFRPKGVLPDIVDKMVEAVNAGPKMENPKVIKALEYAKEHDWNNLTGQWLSLFEEVGAISESNTPRNLTADIKEIAKEV